MSGSAGVSGAAWIQTFTGKKFFPLEPKVEDVDIRDIARALSLLCRFGGHCKEFYSVAQHSVLVSKHCDPIDALWGLLHDASEAYLMDLTRPVKHELRRQSAGFSWFDLIETKLMTTVCTKFNLVHTEPESVKKADLLLLCTEARDLMAPSPHKWTSLEALEGKILEDKIVPMHPALAELEFLNRYEELSSNNSYVLP